jgi:L-aminopeptidase/D-esterase-like protein
VITDVAGIRVGHWTDARARTGCTVVLPPPGTVGSGEVRGGAPGTRETDLLRPGMLVHEVHAVLLTGGSAFGLAAADGVMRWLEERRIGFDAGAALVPIVPTAVLFDLGVGDGSVRPGPDQGYAACVAATEAFDEGPVGAGAGATVAKLQDRQRGVPGGLGSASVTSERVTVGAIAAVNAVGEVVDDDGNVLVGAQPEPSEASDLTEEPPDDLGGAQPPLPGTNTTLAVVATDARLSRERAHLLAIAAHDGIARAVRPAHTMWDGDTVFTLATGGVEARQPALEAMVEEALARAIRRAVSGGER